MLGQSASPRSDGTYPPAPPAPPDADSPRGKRRWRSTALLAMLALVVGGGLVRLALSRPVEQFGGMHWKNSECIRDPRGISAPDGTRFGLVEFRCNVPDQPIRWGTMIHNTGRVPVTVTDITYIFSDREMAEKCKANASCILYDSEVRLGGSAYDRPRSPENWAALPTFEPFQLRPGGIHRVYFGARLGNCGVATRAGYFVDISYRMLGITKHMTLPWYFTMDCR